MRINGLRQLPLALGFAAAMALGSVSAAHAKKLKVQTSSNASHASLVHLNKHWVPKLKEMTGGTLEIELLPIKAVVPHTETPKAVSLGILDGDLTAVSYFSGRDPAFALLGDLIAGYDDADQLQAFCEIGGGRELLQKLWDKYQPGIKVVGCDAYTKEAFVSKVPIKGVADFKGVKVRSPEGLAAEVFKRVGASPVSLPGSEVYTSLEKGVIDAADNSAYANNDANGLHKVAKFPLFPGIHSMPVLQFTVSKKAWVALTPAQRTALEVWYTASRADLRRAMDLVDRQLVARDKAAGQLTIIDWSQPERAKFREVAAKAWADMAKGSPLADEVYKAHVAYMKKIDLLK